MEYIVYVLIVYFILAILFGGMSVVLMLTSVDISDRPRNDQYFKYARFITVISVLWPIFLYASVVESSIGKNTDHITSPILDFFE